MNPLHTVKHICNSHKPTLKSKIAKELALLERGRKNNETVTMYIKHLADSADFKGSTFNKLYNGLIGNRFEMPNVSYTHPLAASLKLHRQNKIIRKSNIENSPRVGLWNDLLFKQKNR